jgi:Glutaredoxin-like domain (DUF836)
MKLVLYSKPGCHLCEGLIEKLEAARSAPFDLAFELEIRDITSRSDWFAAYEYEIPVLCVEGVALPRVSPRSGVAQLAQMLQKHLNPAP